MPLTLNHTPMGSQVQAAAQRKREEFGDCTCWSGRPGTMCPIHRPLAAQEPSSAPRSPSEDQTLSLVEMAEIVRDISYGNWVFRVKVDRGNQDRPYLQIVFLDEDMVTGLIEEQHGRKWFLSPHMTRSEVVTTALKAVLTAIEHEAREKFRYKGRAIFNPHFDVEKLVEFSRRKENLDMRTGTWVSEEA